MCKLFSNDSKLCDIADVLNTSSTIQSDLNTLTDWSVKWQLPFNVEKCKSIHFGNKNPKIEYRIHGVTPDNVQDERDNCLKFHRHTATVTKKANQILGLMKKSSNTRDEYTISTLYKTMVRPHLEYGNQYKDEQPR